MTAQNEAKGKCLDELIEEYTWNGAYPTLGVYGYELTNVMTEIGWPSILDSKRRMVRIDANDARRIGVSLLFVFIVCMYIY